MTKRAAVKERDWQNTLVAALQAFGYVVDHTFPLRTKHGWRSGSTLPGKPDLTALRPPRALAIECKTDVGVLEDQQRAVLTLWSLIPCARAWVLRPRDPWDEIQAWMRRPAQAPQVYGFDPMDQLDAYRMVATARQRTAR